MSSEARSPPAGSGGASVQTDPDERAPRRPGPQSLADTTPVGTTDALICRAEANPLPSNRVTMTMDIGRPRTAGVVLSDSRIIREPSLQLRSQMEI
jgi:hypothetical protein